VVFADAAYSWDLHAAEKPAKTVIAMAVATPTKKRRVRGLALTTEMFAVMLVSPYVRSNATSKFAVYPSLAGVTVTIDWRPPLSL
jgi:hypothetical protein